MLFSKNLAFITLYLPKLTVFSCEIRDLTVLCLCLLNFPYLKKILAKEHELNLLNID